MAKIPDDSFGRSFEHRVISSFGKKTVKEIAEDLGQSYYTFRNWLKQDRDMPYEVLLQIAKMSNRSLDWLLLGVEQQNQTSGQRKQVCETELVLLMDRDMEGVVRHQAASLNVSIAEQVVRLARECLEERRLIADSGHRTLPLIEMAILPEERAQFERFKQALLPEIKAEIVRARQEPE